MTLVETLIALGIGSIVAMVLASVSLYSSESFSSMFNYASLNQRSRQTLDNLSQEIRHTKGLKERTPSMLAFTLDGTDTNLLSYTWDKTNKTLTETKTGVSKVILPDCTFWTNTIYQRNVKTNSWDLYETANIDEAKLIQLQWICGRNQIGTTNSESVQSMKIVIRKKARL